MAVGYHKLNSSAARSRMRGNDLYKESTRPVVIPSGTRFNHPMYGVVETKSDFVSDRDVVDCECQQGMLKLSGGFIREWMRISPA